MSDFNAICADCGDAISHHCRAQSGATAGAIPDANAAQNGQVAQMILGSKPSTKDGRQAYNQGYPDDFEVFWKLFPMRKSKRKALVAWRNSVRRIGANPTDAMAQINAGAKRYRDDPNRSDEFTQHGATWLNADGWLDDPLPAKSVPGQRPDPPRPMTDGEMTAYIDRQMDRG